MISLIRIVSSLFTALICFSGFAQVNVNYYKLTRTRVNGIDSRSVSGGQFIAFVSDLCFESTCDGVGVGHGKLEKNKNYSDSQYIVYQGSSYWGNSTTFKFTIDKKKLNVVTDKGDIYVYEQAPAPVGVKTCSLIRKNEGSRLYDNSSSMGQWQGPPVGNSGSNGNTGSGVNSSSSGTGRHVETETECRLCHGTGKCQRCNGNGRYYASGIGSGWHDCTACNRTGHCSQCGGKGKTKTYRYDW